MPVDPSSGLVSNGGLPLDPTTMQALQQQQLSQSLGSEVGGNAATRANFNAAGQAMGNLFPSQAVQQARRTQSALQSAAIEQNPGESDVDYSIRQLHAQRDAIASFNPQAAAQINTQILKLGEMKFEQQRLQASDARTQQEFNDTEPAKAAAAQASLAQTKATGTLAYTATQDPDAELGYRLKAFDLAKPEDSAAFQASVKAGATPFSAEKAAALFANSNTADMRMAGELAKAQLAAGGSIDSDSIKQMAGESLFDPSVLSRVSGGVRAAVAKAKVDAGITITDEAQAKLEYRAMQTAVGQAGRRDGNMQTLEGSMQGMGQNVLDTLQGVTRTDWRPLNAGIAAGNTAFSDPGEKAYGVAIQSFVNDYARVVAGGTGVSTDSAREDAKALISRADGPAAVKAAVQQMAVKETQIIRSASDSAIEVLSNPNKYPTLSKIQDKLRIKYPSNADSAATAPAPAPNSAPAAASGLPSGWSVVQH